MNAEVVDTNTAAEALAWPERAKTIEVRDAASYQHAAGSLIIIKGLLQRIEDAYGPHIKRAHEAHKALLADRNHAAAPLVAAEMTLKGALACYEVESEQQRQVEERRLRELARQHEEQRRLDEAAQLEREGQLAEAAALIEQPIETPTIILPPNPKVAGVIHRGTWSAHVRNKWELIRWVAKRDGDMDNLITINQTALNALARAQQGKLKVAGVEAIFTPTVAVRS